MSGARREAIDRIRDGVDWKLARNDREWAVGVWKELRTSAIQAIQRGWAYPDWIGELESARSVLGRQAALERGRDIGSTRLHKKLRNVWDSAEEFLATAPPKWTKADIQRHLADLVDRIDRIDASDWPLRRQDLLVFRFAVSEGIRLGNTRPALPRWRIGEHLLATLDEWADANTSERVAATAAEEKRRELAHGWAKRSLERLERAGLLRLHRRGRPHGNDPKAPPRANLYQIPTELVRGEPLPHISMPLTRPMGQEPQTYGTDENPALGQEPQTYGTETQPTQEEPMNPIVAVYDVRTQQIRATKDGTQPLVDALAQAGLLVEVPAGRQDAEVVQLRVVAGGGATDSGGSP